MVRKRGGSRALGHRRRSKARDTEEPRQKGHQGTPATQRAIAHAQKTPPPFAEDEVDLALSRNIAQLLYQAECEKIEVAQRAINVKTRWWNTMAHGRDLHHCPACAFAHSKRTPSSDTVANSTRRRASCTRTRWRARTGCSSVAVVLRSRRSSPSSRTSPKRQPSRGTARHLRRTIKSRNGTHRGSMRPAAASGAGDCTGGGGRQRACAPGALSGQHVAIRKCACVERPRCCTARAATSRQCPEAWWRCCRHSARAVRLDADAVMACVKSTQVDHTISCTGRAKGRQHAPAPVATEQSRVFSEAVAVEIGMWGDDPCWRGPNPNGTGTATREWVGDVWHRGCGGQQRSRTHVAAFVQARPTRARGHVRRGWVHRSGAEWAGTQDGGPAHLSASS
ncbi:hypothetical protein ERJ75_001285700 [Trypanosoma vivax]|nr:hypothetical protein ERJ75_001285700 [Trypanosoma vivax]